MCSDKNVKYGAILSFDTVCVGSPVIIMLQTVNKQVEGKIIMFRDDKM